MVPSRPSRSGTTRSRWPLDSGSAPTTDDNSIILAPRGAEKARVTSNGLVVNGYFNFGVDAQANDTYVVAIPGITAYVAGLHIYFDANTANTGACTINVNGLGAVALQDQSGGALEDNWIIAGEIVHLIHDGTNFHVMNPDAEP